MISPKYLLLFTCFLFIGVSQAKEIVDSKKLTVGNVLAGAEIEVEDPEISLVPSSQMLTEKTTNLIILSVNSEHVNYQKDFTAEVTLGITLWEKNSSGLQVLSYPATPITLKVDFSTSQSYNDKAIIQLEGGNKMKVEIISVTSSASTTPMNLELEAKIQIERYYNLDINQIPVIAHNTAYVTSRNELEVKWDNIYGAEEYELEWTYVNNLAENTTYLSASQVDIDPEIFRINNTRVSLSDLSEFGGSSISYRIPLIYEQGFILYRLRAIGAHFDDVSKMKVGTWSTEGMNFSNVSEFKQGGNNNYYVHANGHQKKLNWQSSVTFIEEGKNKVAVSYADGTLRSRQQVSRLNSEDETVIGETVYDHQGRKAIDIIPAPTGDQKIDFKPSFNKNLADSSYNRKNFDKDAGGDCKLSPEKLSTTSGAGNYYSPNNPIKSGVNSYIPDAKGYPFIQTVYTNDNTGRVSSQGGIGEDHQIGTGHETKNYYGKPLQVEIDRMFGSEAGVASHYQKNLVVDPNGQVTVSYIDLQGNVVATSLAGESPTNLKELNSNALFEIEVDLLKPEYNTNGENVNSQNISHDKMSKIFSQELLVSTKGQRDFNYNIIPERLDLSCSEGDEINLCFECVYNIEILIEDKCGKQYFLNENSISHLPEDRANPIIIGENLIDVINDENNTIKIDECKRTVVPFYANNISGKPDLTDNGDLSSTPIIFEVGDYSISKVLTVNKQALSFYTEEYLAANCHKTLPDFEKEKEAKINLAGCSHECSDCVKKLGDFDQYDINVTPDCDPCLSFDEYTAKVEFCEELCDDSPINCSSLLDVIKSDVTPLGQYGELYDSNTETENPTELSVYREDNELPANFDNTGNWRHPLNPNKEIADQNHYYRDNGEIATINITVSADGKSFPEIIQSELDKLNPGEHKVEVQYLKNLIDFVYTWEDNFANSLISYHPEYPAYQYCMDNLESHKYDDILLYSTSLTDFKDKYLDAFNKTISNKQAFDPCGKYTLASDPYLIDDAKNPHYASSEHAFVKYFFANYKKISLGASITKTTYTLPQFAHILSNCPQAESTSGGTCSDLKTCLDDFNFNALNGKSDVDLNTDWLIFKSLYISLKQKFQDRKRIIHSIQKNYYSGCIGMESWSPFSGDRFGFYPWTKTVSWFWSIQYFNPKQACSFLTYKKFRNKKPRSIGSIQINEMMDKGMAIEECFMDPANAPDEIKDENINFETGAIIDLNCENRDQILFDRAKEISSKTLIDACGECPITHELSHLLDGVIRNGKGLLADKTDLGCYPQGLAEWTNNLESQLNFIGGTSGYIYQPSSFPSASQYQADISNGNGEKCTIKLAFKPDGYSYLNYETGKEESHTFSWSDIKSICCLSYNPNPDVFTKDQGKNFNVTVAVDVPQGALPAREVRFVLEGVSSHFILNECTNTICNVNQVGSDLVNFFNGMLYKEGSGSDEIKALFTSVDKIEISDATNKDRHLFLTDVLKTTTETIETGPVKSWFWKADESSNELKISLTPNGDSGQGGIIGIDLTTEDGTGINFNHITRFVSIKPVEIINPTVSPYSVNGFELEAELKDSSGNLSRRTLIGSTTFFEIGECEIVEYKENANNQ